jgi:tetratricopeptide (TPR) repeat protein
MSASKVLQKTITHYRDLIRKKPNDVGILTSLAWSYSLAGDYEQAIQQFEQAIQVDSQSSDAYYGLALAYKGAGQYDRAIQTFHQARQLVDQDDNRGRHLIASQQIEVYLRRLQ